MAKDIQRVLGFDYGQRRTGVASGQLITRTASPVAIVGTVNNKPDWDRIGKLIQQWQPDAFVVGLPVHDDGAEYDMTLRARKFGNGLHGRYGLPVFYINERLSSYEAQQRLGRETEVDAEAAAVILQSWLDEYER